MKDHPNIKYTFTFLLFFIFIFAAVSEPALDIQIRKDMQYERPPRLEEEDIKNGKTFTFTRGLEIITDIEYVKVFIFDIETGRTPFESNTIQNGYVRIRLEKNGYDDFTFWVNVKENYRTTVDVKYKTVSSVSKVEFSDQRASRNLLEQLNPLDPPFYRRVYFLNSEDFESWESSSIESLESESVIALDAQEIKGGSGYYFEWDGQDAEGHIMDDGEYILQINPGNQTSLILNRQYSRTPASYFSGMSGLSLVPSAQILFPGSYQFSSSLFFDHHDNESATISNLPFSFTTRFTVLKFWETALEFESSFITESDTPSIKINNSNKFYIWGKRESQISIGTRASYKSALNDFSEPIHNHIIRDPSGFSLYVPFQFLHENWRLYISPEFLFSTRNLIAPLNESDHDFNGVLRLGFSYAADLMSLAFSSALFFPTVQRQTTLVQAAVDAFFYIPDTAMYLNGAYIYQKVRKAEQGYSLGLSLGFLM